MATQVIAEVVLRSPESEGEAASALSQRGFEILQRGPSVLTIGGPQELFEATFDTRLVQVAETQFRAQRPLAVPADWSALIADVVLPAPPELFP